MSNEHSTPQDKNIPIQTTNTKMNLKKRTNEEASPGNRIGIVNLPIVPIVQDPQMDSVLHLGAQAGNDPAIGYHQFLASFRNTKLRRCKAPPTNPANQAPIPRIPYQSPYPQLPSSHSDEGIGALVDIGFKGIENPKNELATSQAKLKEFNEDTESFKRDPKSEMDATDRLRNENTDLKQKLRDADWEIGILQGMVQEEDIRAKAAEATVSELKTQLRDEQDRSDQFEAQNLDLARDGQKAEDRVRRAEDRVSEMEGEMRDLRYDNRSYGERFAEFEGGVLGDAETGKGRQVRPVQVQIEQLDEEQLRNQEQQSQDEVNEARPRIADLERRLRLANDQNRGLKRELGQYQKSLKRVESVLIASRTPQQKPSPVVPGHQDQDPEHVIPVWEALSEQDLELVREMALKQRSATSLNELIKIQLDIQKGMGRDEFRKKQEEGQDFFAEHFYAQAIQQLLVEKQHRFAPKQQTHLTQEQAAFISEHVQLQVALDVEQIRHAQPQTIQARNAPLSEQERVQNREQLHLAYEHSLTEALATAEEIISHLDTRVKEKDSMVQKLQDQRATLIKNALAGIEENRARLQAEVERTTVADLELRQGKQNADAANAILMRILQSNEERSQKQISQLQKERLDWHKKSVALEAELKESREVLREQVNILEEQIQEMMDERMVSDDGDEDPSESSSISSATIEQESTVSKYEDDKAEDIIDIRIFLARAAGIYFREILAYDSFKAGKITEEAYTYQQELLLHKLDMLKSTPSRERALESWSCLKEEIPYDTHLYRDFVKQTIVVMELEEKRYRCVRGFFVEIKESLESLLHRLPKPRKRVYEEDNSARGLGREIVSQKLKRTRYE